MQAKGPQTYSQEELTSIRKADAARGKDSPLRPPPPPGKYYAKSTGYEVDIQPEPNTDPDNVSREKSFRHNASVAKDKPPSIPNNYYVDKLSGAWVHVPPDKDNYDREGIAREQKNRNKAAVEKDRIKPQPKGFYRDPYTGHFRYIPAGDEYVSDMGYLGFKPHPDASVRESAAREKDKSLRPVDKDKPLNPDFIVIQQPAILDIYRPRTNTSVIWDTLDLSPIQMHLFVKVQRVKKTNP